MASVDEDVSRGAQLLTALSGAGEKRSREEEEEEDGVEEEGLPGKRAETMVDFLVALLQKEGIQMPPKNTKSTKKLFFLEEPPSSFSEMIRIFTIKVAMYRASSLYHAGKTEDEVREDDRKTFEVLKEYLVEYPLQVFTAFFIASFPAKQIPHCFYLPFFSMLVALVQHKDFVNHCEVATECIGRIKKHMGDVFTRHDVFARGCFFSRSDQSVLHTIHLLVSFGVDRYEIASVLSLPANFFFCPSSQFLFSLKKILRDEEHSNRLLEILAVNFERLKATIPRLVFDHD